MTELLLTEEQSKLLEAIQQPIPVRDADLDSVIESKGRSSSSGEN